MASRIALGITLALLLATCYLGYQTRIIIQGLHDNVSTLTTEWNNTKDELAKTKDTLKNTEDTLTKTQSDLKTTQDNLATTQSNLDAANKQIADLTAQAADLNKKLNDALARLGTKPGEVGVTQDVVDKLNAQIKDLQTQITELTTVKVTLTAKVKEDEGHIDDLQKVVNHYRNNVLKNGLEGEVLAVNSSWNFVVLSIGDRQGAVANGEMLLERGGSQIGKVRITSVEPSTSVADIIPGSLARGVQVQPGDHVIFQGN